MTVEQLKIAGYYALYFVSGSISIKWCGKIVSQLHPSCLLLARNTWAVEPSIPFLRVPSVQDMGEALYSLPDTEAEVQIA